jgi:hypothetical protein
MDSCFDGASQVSLMEQMSILLVARMCASSAARGRMDWALKCSILMFLVNLDMVGLTGGLSWFDVAG